MQTDSVEKAAGIGAIGLWAALHGWLGWLVVLYAVCMMLDWVTGTVLAIKNGVWSSHKARQGLWHKGGSIIMIFVSVLTDPRFRQSRPNHLCEHLYPHRSAPGCGAVSGCPGGQCR